MHYCGHCSDLLHSFKYTSSHKSMLITYAPGNPPPDIRNQDKIIITKSKRIVHVSKKLKFSDSEEQAPPQSHRKPKHTTHNNNNDSEGSPPPPLPHVAPAAMEDSPPPATTPPKSRGKAGKGGRRKRRHREQPGQEHLEGEEGCFHASKDGDEDEGKEQQDGTDLLPEVTSSLSSSSTQCEINRSVDGEALQRVQDEREGGCDAAV